MSAKLIDGKEISTITREKLKQQVESLKQSAIQPGLAVVIVGEDPASQVYVRNKVKACESVGIYSEKFELSANTSQEALHELISELNKNAKIHGILLQLPLPEGLDEDKALKVISPDKDVDGLHLYNIGALVADKTNFVPCTPYGITVMLKEMGIEVEGKDAVVVGRSRLVGKPIAMLLLQMNATVTICTSRTKDLKAHTSRADILVVATGRPKMITADMVKPGAVVIDVGINRDEQGKLVGDVDFDGVKEVAGYITPVPGGVGPMTITMLLANTINAAERTTKN